MQHTNNCTNLVLCNLLVWKCNNYTKKKKMNSKMQKPFVCGTDCNHDGSSPIVIMMILMCFSDNFIKD